MSEESAFVEVLAPKTTYFYLTAIALQGGAISVGCVVRTVPKITRTVISRYHSVNDLNDLGYPKSGEPRTNAIAWYIKKMLESTLREESTVEIWLCDQIAYGHLVDFFDVMPAVVSDRPENKALRELLTTLAYYRNRYNIQFRIGYMSKEGHPTYKDALAKIPQCVKVLPTMTNIRKKEVRILEGVDGLKDLGEKCVIGGNSLLLKTQHRHLVPQERDDLDFVSTMEDADEPAGLAVVDHKDVLESLAGKMASSRFSPGEDSNCVPSKGPIRRRDRFGRTSSEFFTEFQEGWGVFKFLGDLGIKFFGRFRDQDSPQPIEKTSWEKLNSPRISVYWGGSFGHKVGNAGPFEDFTSAILHVLSVLGLNPDNYKFVTAGYITPCSGRPYSTYLNNTVKENHEYLIIETVRGLLKSSNLLKGKEGLSEADVGRLEASIKEAIQDIFVEEEVGDVTGPVAIQEPTSDVDSVLKIELKELDGRIAHICLTDTLSLEIDKAISELQTLILESQERLDLLLKRKEELGDLEEGESLKKRRDKILAFLAD